MAPLYPAMRGMALWGFSYVAFVPCAGGAAEYVNNGGIHHAVCETCHSER